MDDDDFEILHVDALCKEPSPAMFGFKINVDSLKEQTSIELFRKHSVSFLTKPYRKRPCISRTFFHKTEAQNQGCGLSMDTSVFGVLKHPN